MNLNFDFLLYNFQWYRKIVSGKWWKIREDYIDDWGSTITYWTREQPKESKEENLKLIVLKEEQY